MKITVEKTTEFKPIKIELVIETKDELLELWHRLNVCPVKIAECSSSNRYHPFPKKWNAHPIFDPIDDCVLAMEFLK